MSTERDIVLVTGSSGWIGRYVCARLRDKGCRIGGYDKVRVADFCDVSFIGDLDSLAEPIPELASLLNRTRAVIHCAGRAHRPVETPEEIRAFESVNVRGTQYLVDACRKFGVDRIVYVSTIAAYDWERAQGSPVAEDEILKPTTAYARTKIEGERIVAQSGLDWRAVRLATVFGKGDQANFAKLARGLKRKRFVMPGKGLARKSVIPVDLAAEVLVEMALRDSLKHRLINTALRDAPSLLQICDGFSNCCGFPRAFSLPMPLLKALAAGGSMVGACMKGFPLTLDVVRKLTTSTVIETNRLQETLPDLRMPSFVEALDEHATYYCYL